MDYSSAPLLYGLFLFSVLLVYWLAGQQQWRLWIMLIASLLFYASLQVEYIPLLLAITLINYRLGIFIGASSTLSSDTQTGEFSSEEWHFSQADWSRRRLSFLWLGIILNVVLLLGFKYVPFILSSILADQFNWPVAEIGAQWFRENIVAPLGLSFFCFESIAYLIDVYRGAPASNNFLRFAAYKLFFPKLISGPITRYHHLLGPLKNLKFPGANQMTEGLWLIAIGAIKKGLLANHLARVVNISFENLQRAGSEDLWLTTIAYGLQLYLDFSGYVDIARGSAMLLGFNLPQNFDFPYFTTSLADFWRRWHITLGDWLRNYLYFPLGGSRQGLVRTCLNLGIVMLIAGIWHGAAWGFIVWGILHGIGLIIHRMTDAISKRSLFLQTFWKSVPGTLFAWLLTQAMVFMSWIYFRLPDLKDSNWVIQHFWGHPADLQFTQKVYQEAIGIQRIDLALMLVILMILMGLVYLFQRSLKLQLNWPLKVALVPLCLLAVWLLAPEGGVPFIYFDF